MSTDVLQWLTGDNPAARQTIGLILRHRFFKSNHTGEVFFHMEKTGGPSRWNTLRALRVLRMYDREHA